MSSNLIETKVDSNGLTQLIQRLGRDCTPTQFVREFVQNGMEAIQRTKKPGQILIDVDWKLWEKTERYKICFIDTGDGMTPDEMLKHLNNLSSSGQNNNVYENYGVGAKIAALTRNHAGIIYESWKKGSGCRIFIHFDQSENKYGVLQMALPNGDAAYCIPLSESEKPVEISEHGTKVTLLGMSLEEDTMLPPAQAKGGRENWLSYYVNSRYFRIPDDIKINVRIGYYRERENKKHNYTREINGQLYTLERFAQQSGQVSLSDAMVHWWILAPEREGHSRELVSGHTGCINQNELFDIAEGRSSKANHFGIYMGKENIVLYVEPSPTKYVQNTSRTGLVEKDGSPLPWSRWEDEFRGNMPSEIEDYVKRKMSEVSTDSHEEKIRDRLKSIAQFYKISRYRASVLGTLRADPGSVVSSSTGFAIEDSLDLEPVRRKKQEKPGQLPGSFKELLMSGLMDSGVPAVAVTPDKFPTLTWVSIHDGSRGADEMDDRAAQFLPKDNRILANADFQGFKDVTDHFISTYAAIDGSEKVVKDIVTEVFEQQLIEVVTGAQSFKNRPKWKPEEFDRAISEEALTASVMPRYFLLNHIRRQLGNHFKNFKVATADAE